MSNDARSNIELFADVDPIPLQYDEFITLAVIFAYGTVELTLTVEDVVPDEPEPYVAVGWVDWEFIPT